MRSLFELVGFEYTKLFKRKSVVVIVTVILLIAAVSPLFALMGYIYVDGEPKETHYEAIKKDRDYAEALSGRVINEELLLEIQESYAHIPLRDRYTITPEYEVYGRPYAPIYQMAESAYHRDLRLMRDMTRADFSAFYEVRHETVSAFIYNMNIGRAAKEKLIQTDSLIKTPFVYEYIGSYERLLLNMYSCGVFIAFAVAVCLAPMFAGEYTCGADQLILSSRLGKGMLIGAKVFTAVSFCILLCVTVMAAVWASSMLIFGGAGASAPFQIFMPLNPYPLTMGQAAAVLFTGILFGAWLVGAVTLLLSSICKSPFGVMIITSILLFVPLMLQASEEHIVLYNLFNLLPSNMMQIWPTFSAVPYEILGFSFPPFVFRPVFAGVCAVIMLFFSRKMFRRHQVR